jgi:hypothetical protein
MEDNEQFGINTSSVPADANINDTLMEKLKEQPIDLVKEKSQYSMQELRELFPDGKIIACDFYIEGSEQFKKDTIFESNEIIIIDHYMSLPEMEKLVSSTNLAIEYVKTNGPADQDYMIVINHTDTDSILSSAIIRGILPSNEIFIQAAIAADHTGEENSIADLLQALDKERDINFSLRNLKLLLDDKPLEEKAQNLLQKRLNDREKVKKMLELGKFQHEGKLYWAILEEKIDGGLVVGFLPNALLIMLASRLEANPERWEIKLRIGKNVLQGFNLNKIENELRKFDPNYGGRWNAGANKRGISGNPKMGGTLIMPSDYALKLEKLLKI